VEDLGVLGSEVAGERGFALRLAQAHAWGLLDQLGEIVDGRSNASRASSSNAPTPANALHPC
jgi:hypothetical protein